MSVADILVTMLTTAKPPPTIIFKTEHSFAPQKPKEYLLLVRDRASGGKMAGAPTSRNLAKTSLGQGQKR